MNSSARTGKIPRRPNSRWLRLRELCADVSRLRRSELFTQRLELDQQWLALDPAPDSPPGLLPTPDGFQPI